ncbi:ribonuclease III [Boudabousia marimammalium]|uniref:Ribonuclease 3 n=1 Tax=Boudabousia marimammalium TaxID=156892 RepID=A0A1Q5PR47_9ACTO|nr:ribonuclease III [Boudabousia marimammalium]OKL50118.1 ribonuclease III [Boudabousia marimammalium]
MTVPQLLSVSQVTKLEDAWGIEIDPELLVMALTHRSFAYENDGLPHNERLEFLGDSVLSIIVTEYLFRTYPDRPESHLSKMRAASVSQAALAIVAKNLQLGSFILLGRGEKKTGGAKKASILSDTVEALIGATYLCHGLEVTRKIVTHHLGDLLDHAIERGASVDWKTTLQELTADLKLGSPVYEVAGSGPDHARVFEARILVDDIEVGKGQGTSKRHAERAAAEVAVKVIREKYQVSDAPVLTGSGVFGETFPHA